MTYIITYTFDETENELMEYNAIYSPVTHTLYNTLKPPSWFLLKSI